MQWEWGFSAGIEKAVTGRIFEKVPDRIAVVLKSVGNAPVSTHLLKLLKIVREELTGHCDCSPPRATSVTELYFYRATLD